VAEQRYAPQCIPQMPAGILQVSGDVDRARAELHVISALQVGTKLDVSLITDRIEHGVALDMTSEQSTRSEPVASWVGTKRGRKGFWMLGKCVHNTSRIFLNF
jgi:hypothetical protein